MKNLLKLLMAGALLLTSISLFAEDKKEPVAEPAKDTKVTTDCAAINGDRAVKAKVEYDAQGNPIVPAATKQ